MVTLLKLTLAGGALSNKHQWSGVFVPFIARINFSSVGNAIAAVPPPLVPLENLSIEGCFVVLAQRSVGKEIDRNNGKR